MSKPELMVAVESFASLTDDGIAIQRGTRLMSDDPIVRRAPHMFVPFGDGDGAVAKRLSEMQDVRDAVQAGRDADLAATVRPAPKPIPYEDRVLAVKHVGAVGSEVPSVSADGEPLGASVGQILSRKWRLVRDNRDSFIDVVPAGLRSEEAMVATEDLIQHLGGGKVRKVFRGQWVAESDSMVEIHPAMFERAPRSLVTR